MHMSFAQYKGIVIKYYYYYSLINYIKIWTKVYKFDKIQTFSMTLCGKSLDFNIFLSNF